jgi:GWxTD domain-containing protein
LPSRLTRICVLLPCIVLFLVSSTLWGAEQAKNLSAPYRHWLNEEVTYIINSDERKQFLALANDAERDSFMKAFWEVRNPSPGSEINDYKEEHYRRLAYANQNYGSISAQDGWRSDQGRIYITLGAPKQKANYPNSRNVRPMEIWFYQAETPALPTHFYIVFYKRSIGEPYALYSPYQDGPVRLATGQVLNDQKQSLREIRKSLGDEVARTTLSLLPTEPVDLSDYTPSLASDVLLSTIRGLPDNPVTKEWLEAHRSREVVTHRILTGPDQAELEAMTLRELAGRQSVHYLLRYREPMAELIGQLPGGKVGYSMTLQTNVFTRDGKSVYAEHQKLEGIVTEAQAVNARKRRFAAEGRLPLAPGDYRLDITLTNDLTHTATRESHLVAVPAIADTWGVSNILAFSPQPPIHDVASKLPFSVAGIRFAPRGVDDVSLHATDPLRVAFQIWSKPADPSTIPAHKIKMTYSYGRLEGTTAPATDSEEIDASDFDEGGSLLTGHTMSLAGLTPGTYRLVITAEDETAHRKAFAAMPFRIVNDTQATDIWTAYDSTAADGRTAAIDDYKRGLSAIAQANNDTAIAWFRLSLRDDDHYVPPLTRLVDLLSQGNHYQEIAELSRKYPVTHAVGEQTAILMAQANAQTGNRPLATSILESELEYQPPSVDLYLALAKVYQDQGNTSKAEEFRHRATALKN